MNRKEEHNPFDSWLADQLADRKPTFKEEYWLAAQQLIEADEASRKPRKRFWMLWFTYGLQGLALMSIMLLWASQQPLLLEKQSLPTVEVATAPHPAQANGLSNRLSLAPSSTPAKPGAPTSTTTLSDKKSTLSPAPDKENQQTPIATESPDLRPTQTPDNTHVITSEDKRYSSHLTEEEIATIVLSTEKDQILPGIDSILILLEPALDVPQPQGPIVKIVEPRFQPYLRLGVRAGALVGGTFSPLSFGVEGAGSLAGIRAAYRISARTEVWTGVTYMNTSSFNPEVDIQSRQLKFGLNQEVTRYELKDLHLLDIPFGMRRYLGSRHAVQLSLHTLITLQASHEVSLVRRNAFNEVNDRRLGTVEGIRQGIRDISMGLGVGYDYQLLPQMLIGVETQLYPQGLFLETPYTLSQQPSFFIGLGVAYDLVNIK